MKPDQGNNNTSLQGQTKTLIQPKVSSYYTYNKNGFFWRFLTAEKGLQKFPFSVISRKGSFNLGGSKTTMEKGLSSFLVIALESPEKCAQWGIYIIIWWTSIIIDNSFKYQLKYVMDYYIITWWAMHIIYNP